MSLNVDALAAPSADAAFGLKLIMCSVVTTWPNFSERTRPNIFSVRIIHERFCAFACPQTRQSALFGRWMILVVVGLLRWGAFRLRVTPRHAVGVLGLWSETASHKINNRTCARAESNMGALCLS